MRYGRFFMVIFSLVLVLLAVMAGRYEAVPEETIPFSFSIESDQGSETICCFDGGERGLYVFYPGFGKTDSLRISLEPGIQLQLNGSTLTDNAQIWNIQPDQSYPCKWEKDGRITEQSITFVPVEGMPVLHIDVRSGSMDYLHLDKDHKEPGSMRLYDPEGNLLHSEEVETVKGRGNSSWGAEKKPYNLYFSEEIDLLGMGAAQRWILLAEGYNSCINIRNKIVYEFADQAGLPYSPDTEWINLFLNGEYAGLYLLCERNEIHENRVDIGGGGSFLVSMEFEYRLQDAGQPYVKTDSGQVLRIHGSDLDHRELDDIWQSVENAILAPDGIDPRTGKHWQEMIDLDSWVRKYLLEELFANGDGGSLSQFFFYDSSDPSGKIYAGPVWDYDMAMGGYWVWYRPYTDYYVMNRAEKEKGYGCPWFQALYRDEVFYNRLTQIYETEFLPLLETLLEENLDYYIRQSAASVRADGLRWGNSEASVVEELNYIRNFLIERSEFLSDVWIHNTHYHVVRVDTGRSVPYGYFAVKPGQCLPELPPYQDAGGIGWFRVDNDEPFDITQPIYEDVQIYVKTESFQIPKIHYIPLGVLVVVLAGFVTVDIWRGRRNGGDKWRSR